MADGMEAAKAAVQGMLPQLAAAQKMPEPTVASLLGNTEQAKEFEKDIGVIAGEKGKAALVEALKANKEHAGNAVVTAKFNEFYKDVAEHLQDPKLTAEDRKGILEATKALDKPAVAVISHMNGDATTGVSNFFAALDDTRQTKGDNTAKLSPDQADNAGLNMVHDRIDNVVRETIQNNLRNPPQQAPAKVNGR